MALNLQTREDLSNLIVAATKTGDLYLDPAEVKRSHVFRELLVADYTIFLQLTVGIHQHALPPPTVFAEKTKQLATSLTNEWNTKYGAVYKQIDFTNLVPVTEEARSAEQRAQDERSKRIRQKKYEQATVQIEDQASDIQENIRKMSSCFDILVPKLDDEDTLNAIFNAEESKENNEEGDDSHAYTDDGDADTAMTNDEAILRHDPVGVYENALGSSRYKLEINVSKDNPVDVTESADNSEVFATLRECYRLIVKKHWPLVMGWLDILMKVDQGPTGEERANYDRILRLVIDLKRDVADAKSKSEDLGVNMDTMYGPQDEESDEENDEFEEVDVTSSTRSKAKGKQVDRTAHPPRVQKAPKNAVFAMLGEEILEDDPTYAGGTRVKTDSSRQKKLLSRAPVVAWDEDLAIWDKKEIAFNTSGLEFAHRFLGVGDGSNLVSDATLERMKMRTTVYTPEVPKVIKACRFPMSNGKLCMRRDLVRCPYHGPVVPRDELGQIQLPPEEGGFVREDDDKGLNDAEEADLIARAYRAASTGDTGASSKKSRFFKDTSTWEDIEDDVHNALGLEKIEQKRRRGQGTGEPGGKKKAKKPLSALVNITKPPDSSKVRLQRHMAKRDTQHAIVQDRVNESSAKTRDSRLNLWGGA
ncbi:hypothetical protein BGZ94_003182 [Podila epigama]|nr:hypothetical protein BGZ94_003182 [Podila epigama]